MPASPQAFYEAVGRLTQVSHRLQQELGREPTADEIARTMHISPDKVRQIVGASQQTVSLPPAGRYGIQNGPDGKTYIARVGETKLATINNPNVLGAAIQPIGLLSASHRCSSVFIRG